MSGGTNELLTADETSRFFRISKTTLYKLARDGEIPAYKIGREWRFVKNALLEWIVLKSKHNMATTEK